MIMSRPASIFRRRAFARISSGSMPGVSSMKILPFARRAAASASSRQLRSESMPERIR